MANTYTQMYVHLVFAPKNKKALIGKEWKNDPEKYITGIVQNHGHKLLAIGSMPNHIHLFIGYNVNHLIPKLVKRQKLHPIAGLIKANFQNFISNGKKVMVLFLILDHK